MIRVAILSFWHVHAKDYTRQAEMNPHTRIVAIWDEEPERGRQKAEEYGVRFYENLQELLANPDIDAVIVVTPTAMHPEVMIAAANAGKHIFTEKVVAVTVKECQDILAAVKTSGVRLTVSLPRAYTGFADAILRAIREDELGKVTTVRIRLAHNGALPTDQHPNGALPAHFFNLAQSGGGALMDLGCHPMYLARMFLGLPERVSACFGYILGHEVEEHAAVILQYPSGSIGIVEAGFVNSYSQFDIEVQGTQGSMKYSRADNILYICSSRQADAGWQAVTELREDIPAPFEQWVSHIQHGTTASENMGLALDLTRLMEAATISARSGAAVQLQDLMEME